MDCSPPVHHQLLESAQTHVHWVSNAVQPSRPLSPPSTPALSLSQHQGHSKRSAQWARVLAAPCNHELSVNFSQCCGTAVLSPCDFCLYVGTVFTCLVCVFSLAKCWFTSSAHLKIMLFCLFVSDFKNIFSIQVLSLIYILWIFPPSILMNRNVKFWWSVTFHFLLSCLVFYVSMPAELGVILALC